jgi:pectinesterase
MFLFLSLILSARTPVIGAANTNTAPQPKIKIVHPVLLAEPRDANPKIADDKYDAIVSHDVSADYKDLQSAINAVPDNGSKPFRLLVKPGTYQGQFIVPKEKAHVQLIGEDVTNTILTYSLNQSESPAPDGKPIYNNAGTVVLGDDFRAENITFQNTSGDHGQALALPVAWLARHTAGG